VNSTAVNNEIGVVPMVDAVEEFKVETNSLKAEFGQTSGGIINVVTKSGTNSVHGSLYEFVRNDAMDARNAFATQPDNSGRIKPVLRYNQYGGTVGGRYGSRNCTTARTARSSSSATSSGASATRSSVSPACRPRCSVPAISPTRATRRAT
jgi:hypothetical protein